MILYSTCPIIVSYRYLNRADVQEALHAREGTVWEQCSTKVEYQQSDLLRPMMPYYQRILNNYDIKILVFSGVSVCVCVFVCARVCVVCVLI